MLTPTRREIVETQARKLTRGAQFWGGRYDGATLETVKTLEAFSVEDGTRSKLVVVMLDDGSQLGIDPVAHVAWVHPAGRRART